MRVMPVRPPRFSKLVITLSVIGTALFCGVGESAAQVYEVLDSAGVELIFTGPPTQGAGSTWTVSEIPVLQIGEVDGEDPYLFMRVWDALRVPDGRLVVVEKSACEIRVFGPNGRHEVTFGRCGEGPREFGGPPWVSLDLPETLVVWVPGHHRVSRYSLSGDLLDQKSLVQKLNGLSIVAFPNGRVWQVAPSGMLLWTRSGSSAFPGVGLKELTRRVVLVDGVRETSVDFGTHPSGQTLWHRKEDRGLVGLPDPFAPFAAVALGPEPFLVNIADGNSWGVRSFDGGGMLRRVLRASVPSRPVTQEVRAQEKERLQEHAATMGMSLLDAERAIDQIPVPNTLPSIGSLFWDTSGSLWVSRRAGTHLVEPREYDVFDIEGRWIAFVEMPPSIGQIFEVGDDYVLAAWQDELDVTYLRMYALNKAVQ